MYSKLCLTSDLAFSGQSTVVDATVNVVTDNPYRNCRSYHDLPPSVAY